MRVRRRSTASQPTPASERKPLDLARMTEEAARAAQIPEALVSAVVHRALMARRAFAAVRELYGWNIFPVPDLRELVRRVVVGAVADHRHGVLEQRA